MRQAPVIPMRVLLEDPVYRAYMKRVPPALHANVHGSPWRLWVETPEHRWLTQSFASYASAWKTGVARYKTGDDFTVNSRRVFYAPPGEWYRVKVRLDKPRVNPSTGVVTTHRVEERWRAVWSTPDLTMNWCGRCRRPVRWMPLHAGHHALRLFPAVTDEDNYRCFICGIRWIAQPDISNMVRMETKP